jgi:single-strand DNA-binding protein
MDYNRVIIAGRLCANPDIKNLPSGLAVCEFRIAANRRTKDAKTTETREETCFVDVTAFNKTATFVNDWFTKGSQILVEGRLKHNVWQTKSGETRSKHLIIADNARFVDPANRQNGVSAEAEQGGSNEADTSETTTPAPAAPSSGSTPLNPVAQRQRDRVLSAVGAVQDNESNIPF